MGGVELGRGGVVPVAAGAALAAAYGRHCPAVWGHKPHDGRHQTKNKRKTKGKQMEKQKKNKGKTNGKQEKTNGKTKEKQREIKGKTKEKQKDSTHSPHDGRRQLS